MGSTPNSQLRSVPGGGDQGASSTAPLMPVGHPGLSVQPLDSLNSVSVSMPTALDSPLKWIFLPVLPLSPSTSPRPERSFYSTVRPILPVPRSSQWLPFPPQGPKKILGLLKFENYHLGQFHSMPLKFTQLWVRILFLPFISSLVLFPHVSNGGVVRSKWNRVCDDPRASWPARAVVVGTNPHFTMKNEFGEVKSLVPRAPQHVSDELGVETACI